MIGAVCAFYAWSVAGVWSGLGWEMVARGDVIASRTGAAQVSPGCLALRAIVLAGAVGLLVTFATRRVWVFPAALAIGAAMSWLRCFALVAICFRLPGLFEAVHAQVGYMTFAASVCALMLVFRVCNG